MHLVNLTSVDGFFLIRVLVRRLESCTTSILNDDGYTTSISNQTTSLRSTLEDHSLSTYCTSTWEPVLDKMLYNRHFHDLFTWLKLYSWHLFRIVFTCVSSSWTQSPKIIILVHIFQFLSRRTVIECVSSLAYQNLISCSPATSSRSSLTALSPHAMSRLCALIWIPLHSFGLSRQTVSTFDLWVSSSSQ